MNKFWDSNIENGGEFVFEANKEKLIRNLDMLSEMPVEEQTLYKKWQEFNSDLHSSMMKLPSLQQHYDKIWKPTDIFNKELTISPIGANFTISDGARFVQLSGTLVINVGVC